MRDHFVTFQTALSLFYKDFLLTSIWKRSYPLCGRQ